MQSKGEENKKSYTIRLFYDTIVESSPNSYFSPLTRSPFGICWKLLDIDRFYANYLQRKYYIVIIIT